MQAATLGEAPATGSSVLRFPQAIAYTPGARNILVADQFSAVVQRFDRSGAWLNELGGYADARQVGRIGVVGGLATDRAGHVYVLDSENDRVQVFEAATGRWLAAWGSTGQGPGQFRLGDNTGAGGLAIAQPTATDTPVAYVADQYNHRIQVFRLDQDAGGDAGHPVLPAGARTGDVVSVPTPALRWGTFGDCSAGTCADPTVNSRFNDPQGIAVDARSGHVLVADDDSHRVVEFLPDGTDVRQIGSYGVGAGQSASPATSASTRAIPASSTWPTTTTTRAGLRLRHPGLPAHLGPVRHRGRRLRFTRALAAVADDPVGGVAVADTANNRVQTFAPDGAPTAAGASPVAGPAT